MSNGSVHERNKMKHEKKYEVKINKLIMIRVSSIIKAYLLYSLVIEIELIQVTSMTIKYANKIFLSWLRGFFPYLSLGVERWLCIVFGENL
jgi:hypothetical protein